MKKSYIFLALALMSGLTYAQSITKQTAVGNLSSVNITKEIDNTINQNVAKAIVDSLHYDGPTNSGIGTNSANTFEVHAFFSAAQLAGHNANGNTITSVKVFINGVASVGSTQLKFYSNQTTVVYSQAFTAVEGWNEVVLTTPFAIPTTDLYIGYECVATGGYPLGCDAGPVNPNGNWIVFGGTWQHLTDLGGTLTYNWNIRAMVDGTPVSTPTAACTPLTWNAGSIELTQSATSSTFTLSNAGGGTLTASSISGVSAPFSTTFVPGSVSLTAGQSTTFTFSFNPTVVGAVNQTAVITTNGGTISITLNGTGIVCNTINSFPFTEGFEGTGFAPDCWSTNDVDGDSYNWERRSTWSAHSGVGTAVSASWQGSALTPNNYLITPQFNINAGNLELTYWVAAQDPDWAAEKYSVMVSTTGKAPADFTAVFTETLADTIWTKKTVSLSAYNGQNIYIAFRHWGVTDFYYMKLDDITIDITTGISKNEISKLDIYPNPTTGMVNIAMPTNTSNFNVTVFNVVGEQVLTSNVNSNKTVVDLNNQPNGVYFVKVTSNGEVTTTKVLLSK